MSKQDVTSPENCVGTNASSEGWQLRELRREALFAAMKIHQGTLNGDRIMEEAKKIEKYFLTGN